MPRARAERSQKRKEWPRPGYWRSRHFKSKYDLTLEEYDLMLLNQSGACKICKTPAKLFKKQLSIDHDHETGKVRGLLCTNCNLGLGSFQDSPRLLAQALVYLEDARESEDDDFVS